MSHLVDSKSAATSFHFSLEPHKPIDFNVLNPNYVIGFVFPIYIILPITPWP
jgi:hypothetical protein